VVDLIAEAAELQRYLEQHEFRFCFIGGIAVQHWGEPRLTRDIDVSVWTGFGEEASAVNLLLAASSPRLPDAREFALVNRVLLLKSPAGVGIDISLAALPFEDEMIRRSVQVAMTPDHTLRLSSPEDLIVMKVFAGRETDMRDARSVVIRQTRSGLDWTHIDRNIQELAELRDDAEVLQRLAQLKAMLGAA
jgi:hypothetical protein